MINKIKQNIWQLSFRDFGSCVYILKIQNKNIAIDTGSSLNTNELIQNLKELKLKPSDITTLILTHNHFDHVENLSLFKNSQTYGDKKEFTKDKIQDIDELKIPEFEIIKTPGHTKGSFCILYQDVLFSGDTIFHNGGIGRTDLEGGSEKDMKESLQKLKTINFKILCPGHI